MTVPQILLSVVKDNTASKTTLQFLERVYNGKIMPSYVLNPSHQRRSAVLSELRNSGLERDANSVLSENLESA